MHKTTHPCGGTHPPPIPPPQPPLPNPKDDVVPFPIPSLQSYRYQRHHNDPIQRRRRRHRHAASISPPFMVTSNVVAAASSWLRNRRIRYVFLVLCSPLLLVLLFAALPFLCAAELCLRRRLWRKLVCDSGDGDDGGDRLRRCEEGCCGCGGDYGDEEKGLLHRYLEDQLLLVRSMYDCGDDEDEEEEEEEEREEDSRRVEDVENLGSSRIPLLR